MATYVIRTIPYIIAHFQMLSHNNIFFSYRAALSPSLGDAMDPLPPPQVSPQRDRAPVGLTSWTTSWTPSTAGSRPTMRPSSSTTPAGSPEPPPPPHHHHSCAPLPPSVCARGGNGPDRDRGGPLQGWQGWGSSVVPSKTRGGGMMLNVLSSWCPPASFTREPRPTTRQSSGSCGGGGWDGGSKQEECRQWRMTGKRSPEKPRITPEGTI